jgi:hypothetical protein
MVDMEVIVRRQNQEHCASITCMIRHYVARCPHSNPGIRLARSGARDHAQRVRHAIQDDLDRLEDLLAELRRFPQLQERRPGYFSRGSRAFLHFHEDAGDLYVDVRLNSKFERMRVTGPREQTEFLSRVRATLADEPSDP